mmetsp:Transcript_3875/g.11234  ORF Transcript_3875/g.11234 Transcript_3875/m.11234 type:complete len:280 (-) Transcript_3875:409-1248(-)
MDERPATVILSPWLAANRIQGLRMLPLPKPVMRLRLAGGWAPANAPMSSKAGTACTARCVSASRWAIACKNIVASSSEVLCAPSASVRAESCDMTRSASSPRNGSGPAPGPARPARRERWSTRLELVSTCSPREVAARIGTSLSAFNWSRMSSPLTMSRRGWIRPADCASESASSSRAQTRVVVSRTRSRAIDGSARAASAGSTESCSRSTSRTVERLAAGSLRASATRASAASMAMPVSASWSEAARAPTSARRCSGLNEARPMWRSWRAVRARTLAE